MDDNSLQRELDGPYAEDMVFRAGRLAVFKAGSGWLKIELDCPDRELEAELLPPLHAKAFHDWLISQ